MCSHCRHPHAGRAGKLVVKIFSRWLAEHGTRAVARVRRHYQSSCYGSLAIFPFEAYALPPDESPLRLNSLCAAANMNYPTIDSSALDLDPLE